MSFACVSDTKRTQFARQNEVNLLKLARVTPQTMTMDNKPSLFSGDVQLGCMQMCCIEEKSGQKRLKDATGVHFLCLFALEPLMYTLNSSTLQIDEKAI